MDYNEIMQLKRQLKEKFYTTGITWDDFTEEEIEFLKEIYKPDRKLYLSEREWYLPESPDLFVVNFLLAFHGGVEELLGANIYRSLFWERKTLYRDRHPEFLSIWEFDLEELTECHALEVSLYREDNLSKLFPGLACQSLFETTAVLATGTVRSFKNAARVILKKIIDAPYGEYYTDSAMENCQGAFNTVVGIAFCLKDEGLLPTEDDIKNCPCDDLLFTFSRIPELQRMIQLYRNNSWDFVMNGRHGANR